MYWLVSSDVMTRTTVDIDKPILTELKALQRKEGKSLGRLVSGLLSDALARHRGDKKKPPVFKWNSRSMRPLVDLSDKDALYAVLDRDETKISTRRKP